MAQLLSKKINKIGRDGEVSRLASNHFFPSRFLQFQVQSEERCFFCLLKSPVASLNVESESLKGSAGRKAYVHEQRHVRTHGLLVCFQRRALQSQPFTENPKVQADAPPHRQFQRSPASLTLWMSVPPLWLEPTNQLRLELLTREKGSGTPRGIHTLSKLQQRGQGAD